MTVCLRIFFFSVLKCSLYFFRSEPPLLSIRTNMAESTEALKPSDIILNASKNKGWRKSVYIAATLAAVGGVRIWIIVKWLVSVNPWLIIIYCSLYVDMILVLWPESCTCLHSEPHSPSLPRTINSYTWRDCWSPSC